MVKLAWFVVIETLCGLAATFSITDQPQKYYLRPNDNQQLSCSILGDDFNIDLHAPRWEKLQYWDRDPAFGQPPSQDQIPDWTTVADPLILRGDFNGQSYYTTSKNSQSTPQFKVQYNLNLNNVRQQESGRYMCATYNSNNQLEKSVTHEVYVADDFDEPFIYHEMGSNNISTLQDVMGLDVDSLRPSNSIGLLSGQRGFFMCMAKGGFPDPDIRVFIGDRQITTDTGMTTSPVWRRSIGHPGNSNLSPVESRRVVYSTNFPPEGAAGMGSDLRCEIHNENPSGQEFYQKKSRSVPLSIQGTPMADAKCKADYQAPVGYQDLRLICLFTSKPAPTRVTVKAEDMRETVEDSQSPIREMRVFYQRQGEDQFLCTLEISRVSSDHFQAYTMTVTNDLGEGHVTLTLTEGEGNTSPPRQPDGIPVWALAVAVLVPCVIVTLVLVTIVCVMKRRAGKPDKTASSGPPPSSGEELGTMTNAPAGTSPEGTVLAQEMPYEVFAQVQPEETRNTDSNAAENAYYNVRNDPEHEYYNVAGVVFRNNNYESLIGSEAEPHREIVYDTIQT